MKRTKKEMAELAARNARRDDIGRLLDSRGVCAALAEVTKNLERVTSRTHVVDTLHRIERDIVMALQHQEEQEKRGTEGVSPEILEMIRGPEHLEPSERKRRKIAAVAGDERGDQATRAVAQDILKRM